VTKITSYPDLYKYLRDSKYLQKKKEEIKLNLESATKNFLKSFIDQDFGEYIRKENIDKINQKILALLKKLS
jgi:hypothetical protein